MKAVGARLPRYDGIAHVTGRTQYVDDVRVHGTLWCKALRSPHHSALIRSIDTSRARALPGVHAIVTHEDVPHNVYGHLEALGVPADEPLLAQDDVRWKGQPIAAVAAESEEIARAAVEAIEIEFEEREPILDIRTAADPGAGEHFHQWGAIYPHFGPHNHRRVRKGDVEAAFEKADLIVEGVYRPQAIEHCPLETQVALVVPEPSGRLTI
jgi:CO/xanthine dehydrogenase Mo-binding subunit